VDFLDWYSERNVHDVADEEDAPDAVTLGSVHSFKGLERKAVWIVGCEEGRWPRSEQGAAYQESLRLFYVAATRGKDRVRLCTSLHKPPSRFIFLACPDWSVPNV
jgi:superfamily I DNA/RNA helicase